MGEYKLEVSVAQEDNRIIQLTGEVSVRCWYPSTFARLINLP